MLQLGVLRVEGGSLRWRNRIYERAFSRESWAKRLFADAPADGGSSAAAGGRGLWVALERLLRGDLAVA